WVNRRRLSDADSHGALALRAKWRRMLPHKYLDGQGSSRSRGGDAMRIAQLACGIIAAAVTANSAWADDALKLAVGQRGLWDTAISEVGQRGGIFKKHGLSLEILYTQGTGETQQAVLSGSVEVGVGIGVMGAFAAYSKGAPVRVIGAEMTG